MAASDDPDRQVAALHELHRCGAWPAAELIARQLRGLPRVVAGRASWTSRQVAETTPVWAGRHEVHRCARYGPATVGPTFRL